MAKPTTVPEHARTVLCLLRHGDAGDALALAERDVARPLTGKGRKQVRRAGKALARMGLLPVDVWTSRLRRSLESAEVATAAAGASPRHVATAALSPEALPERIAKALVETPPATPAEGEPAVSAGRGAEPKGRRAKGVAPATVVRWIVGHDPHLSRLLGHLTGAPPTAFRLSKGAVAVVECDGRGPAAGTARLVALLPPEVVKALKGR